MPVFELILSSDTINEGRIKINDAFSATTGLWSGGTGFQSLISNNDTGNIASGDYAIATGSGTTASGDYSFASGINTLASGEGSHAEGGVTFVFGNPIYFGSTASTYGAHAEGISVASGINSHSEGFGTIASGNFSHAEGSGSDAIGAASHAEGSGSYAIGAASHAEGQGTTAVGNYSHAEGSQTTAIGSQSHAGGLENIAFGSNSYTAGNLVIASGTSSFAGGQGSLSSSPIIAQGNVSFAFYEQDATISNYGVLGNNSVILGGKNHFINSNSETSVILGGLENRISATTPVPANGMVNIGGSGNTVSGEFSAIIGGQNNVTVGSLLGPSFMSGIFVGKDNRISTFLNSSEYSTIIGGLNNEILNSDNSSIIGGDNNNLKDDSTGSIIIGGREIEIDSSDFSVSLGGAYNKIDTNDNFSIITGRGALSTSATTFTMGYNSVATSPSSANNTIVFHFGEGDGFWDGTVNGGPADYAEYFEWKDGNPSNEDRVGYFVSIDGDKIEKGNYNIIGVVSSVPVVVGDSAPLKWNNMYLKDEFGRNIKDSYSVHLVNSGQTNEMEVYIDERNNTYSQPPNAENMIGTLYDDEIVTKEFLRTESLKRINPNYNHNQIYIPRKDRPEWTPVGLLGKLHIRTAEQITGSTIGANSDGIAINGSDYHVLETIKDYDGNYGIVKILFK